MKNTKIEKDYKQFDLGAILNITTGKLLTSMDDVYEILNYLTENNVFTHEIPKVMDRAKLYILSKYPELKDVDMNISINNLEETQKFVYAQKKVYGEKLLLTPMSD